MSRPRVPLHKRFWDKVDRSGSCWEWKGASNTLGYGYIKLTGERKNIGAHRAALIISGMDIPEGYEVCHKCDSPSCVNPAHLFVAKHSDNMADMAAKRRSCVGKKNPHAKLSYDEVCAIREYTGDLTQRELGQVYGVSQSAISKIQRGERW